MQTYLVGGAVRDQLLGLSPSERDWVVVGAHPKEMIEQGYRPIGREFPVFLHPETKEEYALARTERKTGSGYHGFTFHASPEVSLEDDLQRRDLTINAIAQDEAGNLIDPYGGQKDLEAHVLRHVSPAFCEDPVRVLRVARFAARFAALNFHVADETLEQMRAMAKSGELDTLTPERVFSEFQRALMTDAPQTFVAILAHCNAWAAIFPLLGDADAIARTLEETVAQEASLTVRFACLSWHSSDVIAWCAAIRAPRELAGAARLLCSQFSAYSELNTHDPDAVLGLIESLDGIRRPQQFEDFCAAAQVLGAVLGKDCAVIERRTRAAYASLLACDEKSAAQKKDGRPVAVRVHAARREAVRAALDEDQ